MSLFDFRPPADPSPEDTVFLRVDDLLSRSGDDLGLDIDASGHLVLVEGRDFD
ncbi:hypothetical protein [Pelagibius marinus]|uniref:hypothetical protein n=1 Tax=Pelagibius marinus TaxID=2762760 RepID=UPI001872F745|nr:hypothetical protein [Pelagibius marinus]